MAHFGKACTNSDHLPPEFSLLTSAVRISWFIQIKEGTSRQLACSGTCPNLGQTAVCTPPPNLARGKSLHATQTGSGFSVSISFGITPIPPRTAPRRGISSSTGRYCLIRLPLTVRINGLFGRKDVRTRCRARGLSIAASVRSPNDGWTASFFCKMLNSWPSNAVPVRRSPESTPNLEGA